MAELFKSLDLNNIRVTHRDVVNDGFLLEDTQYEADALFLDVPNPWEVITHAKAVLKNKGSRICCFSPCIEQVQKTCDELTNQKFKNIETIEFLARNLERNCPSNKPCANVICQDPFECIDLWNEYECT